MHHDFWHERWERNQIGFHQAEVNKHLRMFWSDLGLLRGAKVFVPLCGKSIDMIWLAQRGYSVLGNELSRIAVEDFFRENGLHPTVRELGGFRHYCAECVEILCGDFFDLSPAAMADVSGIYDRASLIAFPPTMRTAYANHLARLTPPNVPMLLITMEYPPDQLQGPPFSVSEEEVRNLFSSHFDVRTQFKRINVEASGELRERGLKRLTERVYFLRRHQQP